MCVVRFVLTWNVCEHERNNGEVRIEAYVELVREWEGEDARPLEHLDELVEDEQLATDTQWVEADEQSVPAPGCEVDVELH